MVDTFPPRGGRGSQEGDGLPVPSNFWQPPEAVEASNFYRYGPRSIFLGWSGNTPIGVTDDRHIMTVAGARAGKTSTLLIPNLMLYDGPAVVLDPKGELATATAAHRADKLGHVVHVLDPWEVADVRDDLRSRFNPLSQLAAVGLDGDDLRRTRRDLVDDAALVAEALVEDQGEANSHWTGSARDFLRAVLLWMVEDPKQSNLSRLPALLSDFMAVDEKTKPADNPFAYMLDFASTDGLQSDVASVIANAADGMMGTQPRERSSILSTARNRLGFLESGPLRDNLATSTLNLRDLKRGVEGRPVTIYLCLPAARMATHAKWLRLFLNMAIATLERTKWPSRDRDAPAPLPVLLLLEEFAALGHMRALEQAAAYMAGYGVKLWSVLQDLTQLKRHYKDGWETFIGNAGTLIAFGNADNTTTDYLSKRLGQCAVYVEETGDLNDKDAKAGRSGIKRNFQRVPLLAGDEITVEFGRRAMRALVVPADGVPVCLSRRYVEDAAYDGLFGRVPRCPILDVKI